MDIEDRRAGLVKAFDGLRCHVDRRATTERFLGIVPEAHDVHDVFLRHSIRLHPIVVEVEVDIAPSVIHGGETLVRVPPDADHRTLRVPQLVPIRIATDAQDGHDLCHRHTPLVTRHKFDDRLFEVIRAVWHDDT